MCKEWQAAVRCDVKHSRSERSLDKSIRKVVTIGHDGTE